jgi:hypothetical protein
MPWSDSTRVAQLDLKVVGRILRNPRRLGLADLRHGNGGIARFEPKAVKLQLVGKKWLAALDDFRSWLRLGGAAHH